MAVLLAVTTGGSLTICKFAGIYKKFHALQCKSINARSINARLSYTGRVSAVVMNGRKRHSQDVITEIVR